MQGMNLQNNDSFTDIISNDIQCLVIVLPLKGSKKSLKNASLGNLHRFAECFGLQSRPPNARVASLGKRGAAEHRSDPGGCVSRCCERKSCEHADVSLVLIGGSSWVFTSLAMSSPLYIGWIFC